ncbi:hypothetical protein FI667_g2981, partial [Globisporangium splendens]
MQDRLHVYPSAGTLLWIWAVGVVAQVVVQVLWWMLVRDAKQSKKHDSVVDSNTLEKPTSWKQLIINKHSETRVIPFLKSWVASSEARQPSHSFLWRKFTNRSLMLTTAVALVHVSAGTILLYARTGALVEQQYEWYSLKATGERLYKENTPLPSAILSTCRFRNVTKAPRGMLTLDAAAETTHKPRTVVYVVPYNTEGLMELSVSQVQSVKDESSSSSNLRAAEGNQSIVAYEKARPVDGLTMFPYFWHSILGSHFDGNITLSPWSRTVDALNLEYRIVRTQDQLASLPSGSNVFVIVQWMPSVLQLLDSGVLPKDANVGFTALSREDCNNVDVRRYINHKQLKFGLLPYGDCSLVDGERFSVIPLGPSFEHGFPINTHDTAIPSVVNRKYLLNLMVSWTVEKPTRIQAMMSALEVCNGDTSHHRCIIEHNDLMFKALQQVDARVGTNLRWMLSSAPNAYVETLKQSMFTLCPHGKNPEQYRIWEALAAGSIPIIEEFPQQSLPGTFYHPSYPTTWKCVPEDIHGVLKQLNAPVLFVRDWQRDLPRIIASYVSRENGMNELVALQQRAKQWYLRLGNHLQADFIHKSLLHFKAA